MVNIPLKGEDVLKRVKKGDPFLMTASLFDKKEKTGKDVKTFLLINDFPFNKFDKATKAIAKMIGEAKRGK